MKKEQKLWTREELILAIALYFKLPFGRLHRRNPEIMDLAKLINRTPDAVAYKLVNLASLDPGLRVRGIKGAVNTSKLDQELWNEFFGNWELLPLENERILSLFQGKSTEALASICDEPLPGVGEVREQLVNVRVNQTFFRNVILSSYNDTCCITGINQRELLIAGHIRPWGIDAENRLNPRNGIALNALHDKAFENGLITITTDYKVEVSPHLLKNKDPQTMEYFSRYHRQSIVLPSRFLPDTEFLKYHNQERFRS